MTMKEWSDAKARIGTEVNRRIEHQNSATRFVESRAFVRSNWKTKKFDPTRNPLLDDSSSEEEEDTAQEVQKTTSKPKNDAPQIVYAESMMSPERKGSDGVGAAPTQDPYALDDALRDNL